MEFLKELNLHQNNQGSSTGTKWILSNDTLIESFSPVDGNMIGTVNTTSKNVYDTIVATAEKAFAEWRLVPAPKRGEIVRQIGNA